MEIFYSTKHLNSDFYFVLGVDDNYPVLYVYKDNELWDWHFLIETTFTSEMANTISCYKKVHNAEPPIGDILTWRQWFKKIL